MQSDKDIRLCEPTAMFDEAWRRVYEGAFPAEEREPEDKLTKLMEEGKLLYHRTSDANGDLLCFTMVSLAAEFSFLAYMATDPTKRSGGWGSKHLKRLLELLKEQYPGHLGLFFEIEATKPSAVTLSEEELKLRERRFVFYQRLGARRMCQDLVYLTPSKSAGAHDWEHGKEWEGELLAIEFGQRVSTEALERVMREIYQRFYGRGPQDALVVKVLSQLENCKSRTCGQGAAAGDCSPGVDRQSEAATAQAAVPATVPATAPASAPASAGSKEPSARRCPLTRLVAWISSVWRGLVLSCRQARKPRSS